MARNILSTGEAATQKGCTVQGIHAAIGRGAIDGERVGRFTFVKANRKFDSWQPNPRRQEAGRESQKGRRRTQKRR